MTSIPMSRSYQHFFPEARDAFIASLPEIRVCTFCGKAKPCTVENFGVRLSNARAALAGREAPRFYVQSQCRACRRESAASRRR